MIRCGVLLFWLVTASASGDVVVLKNANRVECTVTLWTDTGVRIERKSAAGGTEKREVPHAEIDCVEFTRSVTETAALTRAVQEGRHEPLMETWVKQIPWLGRPKHQGGELGLTYAELLMHQPTADRLQRALDVYARIEAGDWDPARKTRARAGRLRVMLRQGRHDEVQPEAARLLHEADDPRVLIELKLVIAEAASVQLAALTKDHPRWEQEDDIRPEHHRLFQEALDGLLFAHVFHGAETDLAARGLWAAALLYRDAGDEMNARNCAEDLVQLYAAAPEAGTAAAWLAKLPVRKAPASPGPVPIPDEAVGQPEPGAEQQPPPAKKPRKPRKPKTKPEPP